MNKIINYSDVVTLIKNNGKQVNDTIEIINANLELPTDKIFTDMTRLISPYYFVGELLFTMRGSRLLTDINYYSKFWNKISDNNKTIRSAYGYIMKHKNGFDQIFEVCEKLKANPKSRQAIIVLFEPNDLNTKDEICTLTIQFLIRDNKLDMIVNMRSNDVVFGLPYDHAMFLMTQSKIATTLNIEIGKYYHNVGSLHLYDKDKINEIVVGKQYPILFNEDFFKCREYLLYIEIGIRISETIPNNILYNGYIENCDNNLGKTFILALILFKIKDIKKRHDLLNSVECRTIKFDIGLLNLIIDYEKKYNNYKGD